MQKPPSEARSIGACLSDPLFLAHRLLTEAERLMQLQNCLREWLPAYVRLSVRVAAEGNGELVLHADSAAASTAVRYRQSELLAHLKSRFDVAATKLVTKIVPTA